MDEILKSVTIQMKSTEQYFPVVQFILLYKVIPTFEFDEDEIFKYGHLNESPESNFLRCCVSVDL